MNTAKATPNPAIVTTPPAFERRAFAAPVESGVPVVVAEAFPPLAVVFDVPVAFVAPVDVAVEFFPDFPVAVAVPFDLDVTDCAMAVAAKAIRRTAEYCMLVVCLGYLFLEG
jgi:hypothetical protein